MVIHHIGVTMGNQLFRKLTNGCQFCLGSLPPQTRPVAHHDTYKKLGTQPLAMHVYALHR